MSILGLMLRATHWPLFAVGCLCLGLVNAVLGAEQLPVPVPNVGPIEIPLGLFSPLVMACLIGIHLKPPTQLWDTSPRRHWLIRAGQAFAAFLPALLACTPLLLHSEQLWTAAVRNTVGLGGMILLATGVIGATRSWMLPFPYVLAALLLGSHGKHIRRRPTNPRLVGLRSPRRQRHPRRPTGGHAALDRPHRFPAFGTTHGKTQLTPGAATYEHRPARRRRSTR
ncbi:hypothetical protein [Saccharopolyspora pogona]|uniref:hypothetical protein n=1 Tax=Saccharopolyspora pogona TaxID=333966 RepID=UPI0016898F98|nr:hypothetical protein [Saccharopolyspora pogona]